MAEHRHSACVLSFKRLFGGEVEPVLRPVLASVGFGALGQFAFFGFFAIWALTERDAAATQIGIAYTCSGLAAVAGALLGGRLSDRIGRQPVIVAASMVQTAIPAILLVPGLPILAAYGVLVVMGFTQPVRGTSQRALLADLIGEDGREEAFGAFRVVLNAGATLGPLLGAVLVTWRWEPLFAGIVGAYALSLVAAPWLRPLVRDAALLTVFLAAIGGWCSYAAFELLLPISLTQTHGLTPATWGLLFALNPIVIVLLQMRITRWTTGIPRGVKLAAGVLLMASPYLLLEASAVLPVVIVVLLVVVLGEMLWAPASEALIANLAPPGLRGMYLGTANAASWLGLSLAPAIGLQTRAAFGDAAMWILIAAVGVSGAGLYLLAWRQAESRRDRSPVGYPDEADCGDARGDGVGRGRRRAEAGRPDRQPARAAGG